MQHGNQAKESIETVKQNKEKESGKGATAMGKGYLNFITCPIYTVFMLTCVLLSVSMHYSLSQPSNIAWLDFCANTNDAMTIQGSSYDIIGSCQKDAGEQPQQLKTLPDCTVYACIMPPPLFYHDHEGGKRG